MLKLETELAQIRGLNKRLLAALDNLKIKTVKDLLWHFPHRYDDFSRVMPIADLEINQTATIRGQIKKVDVRRTWKKKMILVEAIIADDSGGIKAVWFNQPYLIRNLPVGRIGNFAGKVAVAKNDIYLSNPLFEPGGDEAKHTAGIIAIYPETRGITSRGFRYLIKPILKNLGRLPEFIPPSVLQQTKLPEVNTALGLIHCPTKPDQAELAKKRFAFEDLFLLRLNNLKIKNQLAQTAAVPIKISPADLEELKKSLPFFLTASQEQSLEEILNDISRPHPMNRLLQGDVGSGKTVVVAMAALLTAKDNYQAALMAPTEVLANQHYKTLTKIFSPLMERWGLRLSLLTSAVKQEIGDVIVGTHALIQKNVKFENLALVVVDEQHRFGVEQRAQLLRDPNNPNAPELSENKNDKIIEKDLSFKLNGIFFEIQKEIGRFCREKQYADLLEEKLKKYNLGFQREHPIEIGGVKSNFADFIIENKIIVEIKAKPFIEKNDYYQILRYLEVANIEIGLLVNFRQEYLKPKRVLNSKFGSFGNNSVHSGHSDAIRDIRVATSSRLIPHFLSMSATPIPRTLTLTIFGDLDLSIINELPAGRRPIITKIVAPVNRDKAYQFIRERIKEGRQCFVICPRIEPSQNNTGTLWDEVKAVKEEYEKLATKIFSDLKVAMLHGRLKADEKNQIMQDFAQNKTNILVSTSVIEVGVDIPNATIMMIEGADRFGLAQLYQFRGRVGRAEHQSFCFLLTDSGSATVQRRLRSLLEAKNGFELAEMDLAIRGPGEFLGQSQTGMPDLAMRALNNMELVKTARLTAAQTLKEDPDLKNYPLLQGRLEQFRKQVHLE